MRTIMLNSVISADSMSRHIDTYLKPPIEQIEMFDWMAIDKIIDIGYRCAIDQLQSKIPGILQSDGNRQNEYRNGEDSA